MKIIVGLFLMGLSFGVGPCLASCGPLLISYIAGTGKGPWKGLAVYLLFSLARIAVYAVLGVSVFLAGKMIAAYWLREFSGYIFAAAGIFLIVLGILMALGKHVKFKSCEFLHRNLIQNDMKSAIALGVIMGIAPCGPLFALFGYLGLIAKTWMQALIFALSFGAGTLVSPLLLIAVAAGLFPHFLLRQPPVYHKILSVVCGLIIIVFGVQLLIRAAAFAHA
jgi:thioredoxin:protein disulfide reductase